jgi:hypothetical protein
MPSVLKNVPPDKDREDFPVIDRGKARQQAFARYRHIKNLEESERSVEDNLFLENFEAAMPYMWGDWNIDIPLCVDNIHVSTNPIKAAK